MPFFSRTIFRFAVLLFALASAGILLNVLLSAEKKRMRMPVI